MSPTSSTTFWRQPKPNYLTQPLSFGTIQSQPRTDPGKRKYGTLLLRGVSGRSPSVVATLRRAFHPRTCSHNRRFGCLAMPAVRSALPIEAAVGGQDNIKENMKAGEKEITQPRTLKVYGYPFSPWVKKVLVALELKGLAYELDQLNPFLERDRLLKLNPKGKVPVLEIDGNQLVAESVDICSYLDRVQPEPHVLPVDEEQLKRAVEMDEWLEANAVPVFAVMVFVERVFKPCVFQQDSDEAIVEEALNTSVPQMLAKLEVIVPKEGFLLGDSLTVPDVSLGSFVRLGLLAGCTIDEAAYPKLHAYLTRLFQLTALQRVLALENQMDMIKFAKETFSKNSNLFE